jgi:hypothetical protein
MGVIDDARGMSRCSASAIPTGGVRRVQTPSDRQRDFENVALAADTTVARAHRRLEECCGIVYDGFWISIARGDD